MSENKSTGNLYTNQFKESGDKRPPYTGFLQVTKDQINDLIKLGKEGKDVQMKIACWIYPSKKNAQEKRLFLTAETGYEQKQQSATPPPPAPTADWGDAVKKYDDDIPF